METILHVIVHAQQRNYVKSGITGRNSQDQPGPPTENLSEMNCLHLHKHVSLNIQYSLTQLTLKLRDGYLSVYVYMHVCC